MKILNTVDDALYLLDCEVITFDIETQTKGQGYWEGKSYGLSVVAPITFISLYSDDNPDYVDSVIVFDLSENDQEVSEFLTHLFSQDKERLWVAQNAVFDFRHMGVHYGFEVPLRHRIWDTMVIAVRSTICQKKENYNPSLENQLKMFGLVEKEDKDFLANMKDSRGVLHTLPRDQVIRYVALDSYYTHQLYLKQKEIIDELSERDVRGKFGNTYLALLQWPEIHELIDYEQRISRWSANIAIRGLKLDQNYAEKKYTEWYEEREAAKEAVLTASPPNPYDEFYGDLKMLLWWEHLFKFLNKEVKQYKNYFLFEEWDYNIFTEDLSKYILFNFPKDAEGWTVEGLTLLCNVFQTMPPKAFHPTDYNKFFGFISVEFFILVKAFYEIYDWLPFNNRLKKGSGHYVLPCARGTIFLPNRTYPSIQIKKFISHKTGITNDYKLTLFYEWYEFLFRQRYAIPRDDYLNKKKWQPFFFFVVAGAPIPTHEQVLYCYDGPKSIVSDKMNEIISWLEPYELAVDTIGENKYSYADPTDLPPYPIPYDYSAIAQQHNYFSMSKDAISFLLPDKDENGDLIEYEGGLALAKQYEIFLQRSAVLLRADEFIAHSELDGKIHTLLSRGANTGRFKSSKPNLQNVKFRSDEGALDFIGWLTADPGYCLVELDFSNAENKVAAIVSGDNYLAQATETGDFHRNMAMRYNNLNSPDEVTKEQRSMGKTLTFGTSYGMGKYKLRRTLGTVLNPCLPSLAEEMLKRKEVAFPKVTQIKDACTDVVTKRFNQGWVPFINTWTKSRVVISSYKYKNEEILPGYKAWNGAIQGGVGEAIARACVEADEWLQKNGFLSRIVLNVHDSLIVHCYLDEYEEVIPVICKIMDTIIPEKYLQRTIPSVHMATATGPENGFKWGFVDGEEYPFGYTHFVNQWGVHSLSEEELALPEYKREAPTWLGPMHEGWTLEGEIEEHKRRYA